MTSTTDLSATEAAVDEALSSIAAEFRFLLDLTPIDLPEVRRRFDGEGVEPELRYRPLEHDPEAIEAELADIPVDEVEDPTIGTLLRSVAEELRLKLEMLRCRGTSELRSLSIELYGAVSPALLDEATTLLETMPRAPLSGGRRLDADELVAAARDEIAAYRRQAPDLAVAVEVREGSTGLMVSNGNVYIAPDARVPEGRVAPLLHHEVGVHVLTHVNGRHQPLQVLATGLAGHEGTQEGLAVLAEHLAGGLTAGRLRQLAARVVAVHDMLAGAPFVDVHRTLIDLEVPPNQAFSTVIRAFRAGGLTKDAVYLRGLRGLVDHPNLLDDLEVLWLGKMPLTAVPLVRDLRDRGPLRAPLLRPRFLGADLPDRLASIRGAPSLTALIEEAP